MSDKPSAAQTPPIAHLPAARRAAEHLRGAVRSSVVWSLGSPHVPAPVRDVAAARWDLVLRRAAGGADPHAYPAFAGVVAHARTELILRALSARTNRVLAGSRILVVGDGVLAGALTSALTRVGSRVTVATDDPRAALRARLGGLAATSLADLASQPVDHVVVTGEGHAPVGAGELRGTILDASATGGAVRVTEPTTLVRPHVRRLADRAAWIVEAPSSWPEDAAASAPLQWHLLDAFLTLSLVVAAGTAPDEVDLRFAERMLS